jgi:hypothetical protein
MKFSVAWFHRLPLLVGRFCNGKRILATERTESTESKE